MTDFLSEILFEAKKEMRKGRKAQVLCIITAKCSCGAIYIYPNRSRMIRKGENIKAVEVWTKEYETFSKEKMDISIEIEVCQKCF
jgi:hypothetical protein